MTAKKQINEETLSYVISVSFFDTELDQKLEAGKPYPAGAVSKGQLGKVLKAGVVKEGE